MQQQQAAAAAALTDPSAEIAGVGERKHQPQQQAKQQKDQQKQQEAYQRMTCDIKREKIGEGREAADRGGQAEEGE